MTHEENIYVFIDKKYNQELSIAKAANDGMLIRQVMPATIRGFNIPFNALEIRKIGKIKFTDTGNSLKMKLIPEEEVIVNAETAYQWAETKKKPIPGDPTDIIEKIRKDMDEQKKAAENRDKNNDNQ